MRVRMLLDRALEVESAFKVSLADHEIPRPKFLIVKLADTHDVELRFRARPATGEQPRD